MFQLTHRKRIGVCFFFVHGVFTGAVETRMEIQKHAQKEFCIICPLKVPGNNTVFLFNYKPCVNEEKADLLVVISPLCSNINEHGY